MVQTQDSQQVLHNYQILPTKMARTPPHNCRTTTKLQPILDALQPPAAK